MNAAEPPAALRLAALMAAGFVDTLGAFLVLALLPFYAEDFGASPAAVGALVAAFALAQTVTAPAWGRLSDRVGRRPVILAGLGLSIVAYLAFAFAGSMTALLMSRLLQGIAGGTVSVVFAYVSEAVAADRRAEGIGWVTAATSAAAMIGPAVGSLAGRWGPQYPGLVAAALATVGLAVAWRLLPEPQASARRAGPREAVSRSLLLVLRRPLDTGSSLIWIYTFAMLATNALTAIAGLYLERRFGIDERGIWWFFTCLAGTSLVVRLALLGPAVRRWGEIRVLRSGALIFAIGLLAMTLPRNQVGLSVAVAVVALGSSLLYPCNTALISRSAPSPAAVGQVLGVQQAYGGMARIVGPLAAGVAFERVSETAPLLGAGGVVLALAIAAFWLPEVRLPPVERYTPATKKKKEGTAAGPLR